MKTFDGEEHWDAEGGATAIIGPAAFNSRLSISIHSGRPRTISEQSGSYVNQTLVSRSAVRDVPLAEYRCESILEMHCCQESILPPEAIYISFARGRTKWEDKY